MDHQEIEEWYNEQKEKFLEDFNKAVKKGAKVSKVKQVYTRKIRKLHENYVKRSHKAIEREKNRKLRKARLKLKLKPLTDRLDLFKERFEKKKEES